MKKVLTVATILISVLLATSVAADSVVRNTEGGTITHREGIAAKIWDFIKALMGEGMTGAASDRQTETGTHSKSMGEGKADFEARRASLRTLSSLANTCTEPLPDILWYMVAPSWGPVVERHCTQAQNGVQVIDPLGGTPVTVTLKDADGSIVTNPVEGQPYTLEVAYTSYFGIGVMWHAYLDGVNSGPTTWYQEWFGEPGNPWVGSASGNVVTLASVNNRNQKTAVNPNQVSLFPYPGNPTDYQKTVAMQEQVNGNDPSFGWWAFGWPDFEPIIFQLQNISFNPGTHTLDIQRDAVLLWMAPGPEYLSDLQLTITVESTGPQCETIPGVNPPVPVDACCVVNNVYQDEKCNHGVFVNCIADWVKRNFPPGKEIGKTISAAAKSGVGMPWNCY